jgi:hypothetical protein
LDSGLLFDKRIGASCAPIVLNDGTRVVAIVGGKSSESSSQFSDPFLTATLRVCH